MDQDRKEIKREEKRLGFIRESKNRRSGKNYNYDIRFSILGDKKKVDNEYIPKRTKKRF